MKRIDFRRLLLGPAALLVFLGLAGAAAAQSQTTQTPTTDPPSRVARLSDAEGQVSLQPAGVQDWVAADVNRPLTVGDKIWVDSNSRAELDTGSAVIRLGSGTGMSFATLDDSTTQVRLTAGTAIVNVRELEENETYEVDTPNVAVSLQRPGSYRLEVNGAGDTTVVKVVDGQAQAQGGGQTYTVSRDQAATFTGTDQIAASFGDVGEPDDLDAWSMQRDGQYTDSDSRQYLADDVPGAEDLDTYGDWDYTPDDGYAWTPTDEPDDWEPYSDGCWDWIAPWGWTWVDAEPWGFAPFHYGRWFRRNNRWSWAPGPRRNQSVYAPALVGWVGGARGVAGGRVAWFPLAPGEQYQPAYSVSASYLQAINGTAARQPAGHYLNSRVPGAVTAVDRDTFTSGRLLGRGVVHPTTAEVAGSPMGSAAPPIVPTLHSVEGPGSARPVRAPRSALLNRQVVTRSLPRVTPVSFDRQLAAIRANGGRPLAPRQLARLESASPMLSDRLVSPGRSTSGTFATRSLGGMQQADTRSMAEREEALQRLQLPSVESSARDDRPPVFQQEEAARPSTEYRTDASSGAPAMRTDRPPWAQGEGRAPDSSAFEARPPVAYPAEVRRAPVYGYMGQEAERRALESARSARRFAAARAAERQAYVRQGEFAGRAHFARGQVRAAHAVGHAVDAAHRR